ncbi:hypothetical protein IEO21_02308 [Rhodonia placenta]|uniref:Uncharacterized protein n=1 Tax=Rhodonia placenta TaxID=104341 RepID=A0A8H7P7S0_9APHY|nr:hypothetical protein IEO21_02308 [Postia placenta]
MSGPKIRVIVEVYMRNEEPQSRLVVPILPTQTIAELAASVARRRHFSQEDSDKLTLFLADGSELFHEDELSLLLHLPPRLHRIAEEVGWRSRGQHRPYRPAGDVVQNTQFAKGQAHEIFLNSQLHSLRVVVL